MGTIMKTLKGFNAVCCDASFFIALSRVLKTCPQCLCMDLTKYHNKDACKRAVTMSTQLQRMAGGSVD